MVRLQFQAGERCQVYLRGEHKVGENTIQPTVSEDNYTIKGADVTGNIIISVSKELNSGVATEITFTGSGSADVKGGVTQVAENGKDFEFEINEENGYEYTVTLDNETLIAEQKENTLFRVPRSMEQHLQ